MSKTLTPDNSLYPKASRSILAGAVASFLTQPFEVIKTNMIVSPSLYFADLHAKIVKNGWSQYMRGGTLAVVRQGYGFTIYTSMINWLNKQLQTTTNINKYYKYSISALLGKMTAMFFQAPLTLLKTRMEVVSNTTIRSQALKIINSPPKQIFKGLNATLIREGVFSLVHYNAYRFLKDDIFKEKLGMETAFLPAFLAGAIAITVSQPFEVIRSKVSLQRNQQLVQCATKVWKKQGWKGFFIGYMPRLLRKPINSGICWSILQAVSNSDN